jgi:hypothetical protein
MIRMYARHHVEDYEKWRKVYNDFAPNQADMGVRSAGVFRGVDDANDVTIFHDFHTEAEARSFADASELKEAMMSAGVEAPTLEIWFTEED